MSLTKKTALIIGISLACLVLVLYITAQIVLMNSYELLEEQSLQMNVERAIGIIRTYVDQVNRTNGDWAPWDDTYNFMAEANQDFIEKNLSEDTLANLGINIIAFFTEKHQLFHSAGYDSVEGQNVKVDNWIRLLPQTHHYLFLFSENKQANYGVISTPEGAMIVSAQPILTSNNEGPSHGTLVMLKRIDTEMIRNVSSLLQYQVDLDPFDRRSKLPDFQKAYKLFDQGNRGKIVALPENDEFISGFGIISDLGGEPALLVKVKMPRRIMQQGNFSLSSFVILLSLEGLIFWILTVLLMRIQVIRRVLGLQQNVLSIQSLDSRVKISGNDELTALSQSINQMLEALETTEERYRLLANGSADIIWTTLPTLMIDFISPSYTRICGIELDEKRNHPISELFINDSNITFQKQLQKLNIKEQSISHSGKQSTVVELEMSCKEGKSIWTETTLSVLRDEMGVFIGLHGISRDITDRKKAEEEKNTLEEQLRQSQKIEAIGRLAGGVAHDFNNILTGIIGYMDMILSTVKTADPIYSDLQEVRNAAERASGLTQQLLAFSRKQIIMPRVLQPNEIIAQSQKMISRIIGEDIELVFLPDEGLWNIKADPAQIDQILVNLATNARDAMPSGGRLVIETKNVIIDEEYKRKHMDCRVGEYVVIAISDQGQGMDSETIERIFEPFFSTKPKKKGTGLGLSTVYGIIKQNDGFINVYSEVGIGTTFKIFFPHIFEEVHAVGTPNIAIPPEGHETILLVEDEEMVRNLAKRVLERQGYKVLVANNGEEAFNMYSAWTEPIDLLLTDVIMPQMNGKELHEKMKAIRPSIKVLFMSGYTENVIAHHGVLEEKTNFIQKPFGANAILIKVRDVLDADFS